MESKQMKIIVIVASLLSLALMLVAAIKENLAGEWRVHQKAYRQALFERAKTERDRSSAEIDIEFKQLFLPDLKRTDRCITCHIAIDDPGMAVAQQPLQSHSGKMFKHHPLNKFGCTVCHHGQGRAIEIDTAHGEVEYWLTPMLRGGNVQATCLKCHYREPRLSGMDLLNEGRRLFSDLGCVWCHNTSMITPEEKQSKNIFDLTQVALKMNSAWMVEWIEKPNRFRPNTLMPDFFLERSEATAIMLYLVQNSETTETLSEVPPFDEANLKLGKTLFESRACLACHRVGDKGNAHAANLSRVGEKTNYQYLVNWITNPRMWQPEGEMPIMTFNPGETFKIAAYLSTLREEPVSKLENRLDDPEFIDKGKDLIGKYECYNCHNIPGFEDVQSEAPDLANIGSELIGNFDFGMLEDEILKTGGLTYRRENVAKARELWIRYKLKDPRGFDKGEQKKPEERLRMPDFSLTPEQIDALTVFLQGMTSDSPPPSYHYMPTPLEKSIARGRVYFRIYRCFACHGEEGRGGIINPNYTKIKVPALNTLAEKLHLEELEDTEIIMRLLVQGSDLGSITRSPVPQFPVVKGQYKALLELIQEAGLVKKKDPSGPDPPFHMPSWKGTLNSGQINDIVIYLLSEYPWDEDEWDENEENDEQV